MVAPNARAKARRRGWLIAAAVTVSMLAAPVATAPGVGATCSHVLELGELAGEPIEASDRERCEAHYGQLRARRGLLRWTWLSWCTWAADSIPEAGAC
ncbi:hypothetical protein ENSA5_69400 [Enhygromyxa salina]|uniref:Secreted protein n=1 Tax=Enhygromyxa salina TaxID=215803 RepID=A0A2S9XAW4_9BACT|nr:hypothetical protein [Enhygromyxa salina]PRP89997.1 hypothetical protein ENSA5_69400 [Enhygromyxa salina]